MDFKIGIVYLKIIEEHFHVSTLYSSKEKLGWLVNYIIQLFPWEFSKSIV